MVTDQQREEVTSYLHTQAAKLSVEQLLEKRAQEVEALLRSVAGLSDDEARWAPGGEWDAVTILQHVFDSQPAYRQRIARLATGLELREAPIAAPVATVQALSAGIRQQLQRSQALIRSVADRPTDRVEDSERFGDLNWREWALFERVHVKDHLLQVQALKAQLDTPGR